MKELKRLYNICRATGMNAERAIDQARHWIKMIKDTSVIVLIGD